MITIAVKLTEPPVNSAVVYHALALFANNHGFSKDIHNMQTKHTAEDIFPLKHDRFNEQPIAG